MQFVLDIVVWYRGASAPASQGHRLPDMCLEQAIAFRPIVISLFSSVRCEARDITYAITSEKPASRGDFDKRHPGILRKHAGRVVNGVLAPLHVLRILEAPIHCHQ